MPLRNPLDAETLKALAERREQRFSTAAALDVALLKAPGSSGIEAGYARSLSEIRERLAT